MEIITLSCRWNWWAFQYFIRKIIYIFQRWSKN